MLRLGIDIGSTTVKLVAMEEDNNIIYKRYERHMSNVFEKVAELLEDMLQKGREIGRASCRERV